MRKLNFRIGRPAETSRTIAQDLQELEKKQESDRNTYTVTYERLKDSLLTSGKSDEKRAKKLKEYELGSAIGELATAASQVHSQLVLGLQASSTPTPRGTQPQSLSKDAQSGAIKREHRNLEDFATILQRFGDVQMQLAKQRVQFESVSVETNILPKLLRIIEEDVPALQKQKKALAKMESEFDSLKTRLATADEKLLREQRASGNTTNASAANYDSHGSSLNVGQNNAGSGTESSAGGSTLKAEQLASLVSKLRDEVDDANAKLEAAREVYALDLYAFDAKTSDRAGLFVAYLESQHAYYAACAATIDNALAPLRVTVDDLKRFPVYGTSLQDHLLATRREIAYPLQFCAEGLITLDALNEEGLFRIAGGHAKLRNLKRSFDVGRSIDIADFAADVHALTGAIKQYLRELEEPLLTFSLYDSWVAAIGESGEAGRAALKACVDSLPQANYRNLAYLFQFLQLVVRHAETNRMSANNLAICVGPNLLWSPDESSAGARTQQPVALDFAANSNQVCAMIAESLINHYDYYFPKCVDYFNNAVESSSQRTMGGAQSPRPTTKQPQSVASVPAPVSITASTTSLSPKAELANTLPAPSIASQSNSSTASTPPSDQRAPHFTTVTDIPLAQAGAQASAPVAVLPATVMADVVDAPSSKPAQDTGFVTLSSQTREVRPQAAATVAPQSIARVNVNPAQSRPPVRRPPAPPNIQPPTRTADEEVVIETALASKPRPSDVQAADGRSDTPVSAPAAKPAAPVAPPPKPALPPDVAGKESRSQSEAAANVGARMPVDVSPHISAQSRVNVPAGGVSMRTAASNGNANSASSTPSGSVGSSAGRTMAAELRGEPDERAAGEPADSSVRRRSSNSNSNAPSTLPKPARNSITIADKAAPQPTPAAPANAASTSSSAPNATAAAAAAAAPNPDLMRTSVPEESTYL